MLEPAARSLADGHGDAPTSTTPGEAGGVAVPGESQAPVQGELTALAVKRECPGVLELRDEDGLPVLHIDTAPGFDTWKDQAMRLFGAETDAVHRCRELSLQLDVGDGKVDRFDLRRMAHLLSDEFSIEVGAIRCSESALLSYGESELKMEIILSRPAVPIEQESIGIDPVEFEVDDDSLEIAHAIEPSFEDADLEPVTPVMVVEEEDPLPGPAWISRPLVREEKSAAGERQVMVVDRTLRSGGRVSFSGDVFVFGDVNAGAEIQAEGNIIVLGALRGHAHAGARGDEGAIILAFDLRPTHLCIASTRACLDIVETEAGPNRLQGLIRRGRTEPSGFAPEIAHLCEGELQQEPYAGRFPSS
jgi:hypothetical protein